MKKNILIIGDSHVRYFFNDNMLPVDELLSIERDAITVSIFKAGKTGATAYGTMNSDSATGMREKTFNLIKSNVFDHVLISLGEVDCRTHIKKKELFDGVIENYGKFMLEVHECGPDVSAIDIVPYGIDAIMAFKDVDMSALYANIRLSSLIKKMCNGKGFGFFSYRKILTDISGMLDDKFYDIKDPFHVKMIFQEELLTLLEAFVTERSDKINE